MGPRLRTEQRTIRRERDRFGILRESGGVAVAVLMILRMDAAAASHRHILQLQYGQRREDNDDTSFR